MVEIREQIQIHAPIERCFDLARSIEVHLLGTEWSGEEAVAGTTSGLIGPGEYVRWQATHLGVRQHLASKITAFERPDYFQDTMTEGAFRSMQHDHFFRSLDPDKTEMSDRLIFAAPLPLLGRLAEILFLSRYMKKLLQERNRILKEVAEGDLWIQFLPLSRGN